MCQDEFFTRKNSIVDLLELRKKFVHFRRVIHQPLRRIHLDLTRLCVYLQVICRVVRRVWPIQKTQEFVHFVVELLLGAEWVPTTLGGHK